MGTTKIPETADDVLAVIIAAEQHRKFVWTAGRVLRESALWTQVGKMTFEDRKSAMRRLTGLLEELAVRGVLARRNEPQSIGYGNEIGFDFVPSRR